MVCPQCQASFKPKGLYMLNRVQCPHCEHHFYFFKWKMLVAILMRVQIAVAAILLVGLLSTLGEPSFAVSFIISAAFVAVWFCLLFLVNHCIALKYHQNGRGR